MSKVFKQVMDGLTDALAYAEGDTSKGKTHLVEVDIPDVKALRKKLNMTQVKFSETFRIPVETIRNWEQGKRQPEGPARVLLNVIDKEPEAVKRAVS